MAEGGAPHPCLGCRALPAASPFLWGPQAEDPRKESQSQRPSSVWTAHGTCALVDQLRRSEFVQPACLWALTPFCSRALCLHTSLPIRVRSHYSYQSHEDALEINRTVIDSQSGCRTRTLTLSLGLVRDGLRLRLRPLLLETQGGAQQAGW